MTREEAIAAADTYAAAYAYAAILDAYTAADAAYDDAYRAEVERINREYPQ